VNITAGGITATTTADRTYTAGPSVDAISLTTGPTIGGTKVAICGSRRNRTPRHRLSRHRGPPRQAARALRSTQ
jgi:hypothetical protein